MAIVKMNRLRVMAMADRRTELLLQLQKLGCVEITQPDEKLADPQWAALIRRAGSGLVNTKSEISDVTTALDAIAKYGQMKNGLFLKRHPITEAEFFSTEGAEQAKETCGRIRELLTELSHAQNEHNRLQNRAAGLMPWAELDVPLEQADTEHAAFRMGVCPAATEVAGLRAELAAAELAAELISVGADREQNYLYLVALSADLERVLEILRPHSFSVVNFAGCTGTPRRNLDELQTQLKENAEEQAKLTAAISEFKSARDALRVYADRLAAEAARESDGERLVTNGTIVLFEGWAPAAKLPALEKLFDSYGCAWETEEPSAEDEPPVLLENPKWMKPINMVTEMYSLPAYRGIDPNPLIFGFFIFFFGFMFADVAYGIILMAISTVVIRKYQPKGTMGYLFGLGQYLGFSTLLCGIFTGGFFGDAITVFAEHFLGMTVEQLPGWLQTFCNGIAFNPVNDPMIVLVVALIIGVVQLLFGQCIHIYLCFRDHHPLDGFLDVVPWWVVFAGIAMAALGKGATVIWVGAALLVLTQGRSNQGFFKKLLGGVSSLYNITSWLSDVLSYSRLMALMLATSVIASVMNTLGALPGNIFAFLIIFLIGHTFNIGVNLIGTYVHAARLQYLEFYSKFYEEGGEPFAPLEFNTKYVDLMKEEH